jgi:hypothetical protein
MREGFLEQKWILEGFFRTEMNGCEEGFFRTEIKV